MNTFEWALGHVMDREGGYVDHPQDRGGPTKFGITIKTLQQFRNPLPVSAQDLRNLTRQEAGHIYRDLYWDKMSLDAVKDKKVATILFDFGVHSGTGNSIALLQSVLNRDFFERLAVDGIVGPKTIRALYNVNRVKLNRRLIQSIQMYYACLCKKDPTQIAFLEGWLNRTFALQEIRDGFSVFSFF